MDPNAKQPSLVDRIYDMNRGIMLDSKNPFAKKRQLIKRTAQGKLYTERFVEQLRKKHQRTVIKITRGQKYALKALRK